MKALAPILILITVCAHAQQYVRMAEEHYRLGQTAFSKGYYDEAVEHFAKAITVHPVYADAYLARARVFEKMNEPDRALMDYSLCLEILPDQYEVLFSRAVLRYETKRYPQARDDFRQLLRLPQGETNTVYYKQSAHQPGTVEIMTLQSTNKAQLYHYLGLIEMALNNCRRSIQLLDSAITINNTDPDFYCNRALARQQCDDEKAMDDFYQALNLDPDNEIARHNLAVMARQQGASREAEEAYTAIIEKNPKLAVTYMERGYLRLQNGNYASAIQDYSQALALDPGQPEAWLNRGIAREKLNDHNGAYSDITEAINRQPNFALAFLNRGNVLMAQKKVARATEDYTIAILYDPDYAAAYYNRSIAWMQLNDFSKACADALQAKRLGMAVDATLLRKACSSQ